MQTSRKGRLETDKKSLDGDYGSAAKVRVVREVGREEGVGVVEMTLQRCRHGVWEHHHLGWLTPSLRPSQKKKEGRTENVHAAQLTPLREREAVLGKRPGELGRVEVSPECPDGGIADQSTPDDGPAKADKPDGENGRRQPEVSRGKEWHGTHGSSPDRSLDD